jgi:hypothetical protein
VSAQPGSAETTPCLVSQRAKDNDVPTKPIEENRKQPNIKTLTWNQDIGDSIRCAPFQIVLPGSLR